MLSYVNIYLFILCGQSVGAYAMAHTGMPEDSCQDTHVEICRQPLAVSPLLPPQGFWRMNPGLQTYWQVSFIYLLFIKEKKIILRC